MVGPDAFTEVRYLQHHKQTLALDLIPKFADEFATQFGRRSGGLLRTYRADDAEMLVVAMGSVNGTIKDVVDEMREDGRRDRLRVDLLVPAVPARPRCARCCEHAQRVVVLEKCLAVGLGGIVSRRRAQGAVRACMLKGYTVIAGLGGRAITRQSLRGSSSLDAAADELEQVTFLDLNADIVANELERETQQRRSGPTAEAILRRLGTVASGIG